jgi:hypothetical protein
MDIQKKVVEAEDQIKEAVDVIEQAKDAVIDSGGKSKNLVGAAKDLEKAEDAALVACEATEEAEFKLKGG